MTITRNPQHRGDPLFLPDVLRAFGVTVRELPGWRDRGHGDFGRIIGVIAHHTGDNHTPANYIAHHPSLGLCAQIHLGRDGVATMTGVGVAWHAGIGSWPGWPTNNANQVSIGIEAVSDGRSPWPPEQLDAYHRACAAICWYLGLSSAAVIGHKEWAGREQGKWDPGGIDMGEFRAAVQRYIDHPPFTTNEQMKGGPDMAFDQITTRYNSRVDGSPVTLRPLDALLNADANSWYAHRNTDAILRELKANTEALNRLIGILTKGEQN